MGRALDLVAVLLAALAAAVAAQQYNPITEFCRRFSHEAAVLGDRLYINGGQLNRAGSGKNITNNRLLWHDLNQTTRDGKDIQMPVLMTDLQKPADVPSVIGGILWADQANGWLYQYGGEWPGPEVPDAHFDLWAYDTYNGSWTRKAADRDIVRLSFGAGTSVEDKGKGYYFGGWMSSRNDVDWQGARRASNRMIEYDFDRDVWKNSTGPADKAGRAEGVMFYLPVGDQGMLAHFGGVRIPEGDGAQEEPAPMNQIDLYDLAGGKWYTQNATGAIPENRRRFCGGIAYAQDTSSSNIYIYGGLGFGENATGFDDVHILSLPSFQWIKVFPTGPVEEKDRYPHYDLSCSVVRNTQLLIIGGQFPKDPDVNNCDAEEKAGVHNLVMSKDGPEKSYWDVFDPTHTEYVVPEDIVAVVGGDGKGGASVRSPKNNFEYNDVSVLFDRTYQPSARTPTRTAPVAGVTTSAAAAGDSGVFSTDEKRATILVPVLLGTAVLVGLALFALSRRRRRLRRIRTTTEPPGYEPYNPTAADSSVITSSYTPSATLNGFQPPYPLPQPTPTPAMMLSYDNTGSGYSEAVGSLVPPQELPPHSWHAPEPMSIHSSVPGHYPPPLLEGLSEARSPGPEMKERLRER